MNRDLDQSTEVLPPIASWGDRFGAFWLDVLVLAPAWIIALLVAGSSAALGDVLGWTILGLWVYGRLLDGIRGQSPGKALIGLRVVDGSTGGALQASRGVLRWVFGLAFLVVLGPINYIVVPLVSRRHQTMHDMVGGAIVVREPGARQALGLRLWAWSTHRPVSVAHMTQPQPLVSSPSVAPPTLKRSQRPRALVIISLVVVALIIVDWYVRNRELDQLLDAVEQSEHSMVDARHSLESVESDWSTALAAHGCTSQAPSYECQQYVNGEAATIRAAMSAASASAGSSVRQTGAEVEHVGILPWHGALKDARAAYVDHSDAWYRHYMRVSDDLTQLNDPRDLADINSTFSIAHARFLDAIPVAPLFDANSRIAKIWAE